MVTVEFGTLATNKFFSRKPGKLFGCWINRYDHAVHINYYETIRHSVNDRFPIGYHFPLIHRACLLKVNVNLVYTLTFVNCIFNKNFGLKRWQQAQIFIRSGRMYLTILNYSGRTLPPHRNGTPIANYQYMSKKRIFRKVDNDECGSDENRNS
jgi:hypothetical protein